MSEPEPAPDRDPAPDRNPVPDRKPAPGTGPAGESLPGPHPLRHSTADSDLVLAARGQRPARIPVWFMRQAGRSLPEYRRIRSGHDMLAACNDPDLITEITMQPVRRHDVDAAILFSDIVVPLRAAGVAVDIKPGVGPVLERRIDGAADLAQIGELGDISAIITAIGRITDELGDRPLIGFCGAPFTLASYLVEGGPSRTHARTKAMMWSRPELWHELLARLTTISGSFLRAQIEAGASVVQVFDSWAGALNREDYREHVLPHTRELLGALGGYGVPRIHFGVGTGELLPSMAVPECEVVGVDYRVELSDGIERIGSRHSVQGNLDPAMLFADREQMYERAGRIVEQGRAARGHIFNLGHGVLPETDPGALTDLVGFLHSL